MIASTCKSVAALLVGALLVSPWGAVAENSACSICQSGEMMSNLDVDIPADTVSFLMEDTSCVKLELNLWTSQYTSEQCTELASSDVSKMCGCVSNTTNTTVLDVDTPLNITETAVTSTDPAVATKEVKGQVVIQLASVPGLMDNDTIPIYEEILTAFFDEFLMVNTTDVTNITLKVVGQKFMNETKSSRFLRRALQTANSTSPLFPLNTTINVTGMIPESDEETKNLTASLIKSFNSNSDNFTEGLEVFVASMGNLSYFEGVENVTASKPASSSKSSSTKKIKELHPGITAGILVGIVALMCLAIYIASQCKMVEMPEPKKPVEEMKTEEVAEQPKVKTENVSEQSVA